MHVCVSLCVRVCVSVCARACVCVRECIAGRLSLHELRLKIQTRSLVN